MVMRRPEVLCSLDPLVVQAGGTPRSLQASFKDLTELQPAEACAAAEW